MRVAVLGGGNLGQAMARGWVSSGVLEPDQVWITRRHADKLAELEAAGFHTGSDNRAAVSQADTVVLASVCDMMIMVIKHNENDRDLVRRCVKRLRDIDTDIIGAVLNAVDVQGSYYNKYYYGNYYYAEDDDKKGRRRRRRLGRGSGDDGHSGKGKVAL